MKLCRLLGLILLLAALPASAQQIMYSNLDEVLNEHGDTVNTLQVEKRTKNQILLMGGADYRILSPENNGLSRYLRRRCYAVRVDTALYVNCRKMRYKRFRLGNWYAAALRVGSYIYFCAQPVGQVATSTSTPADAVKLGGEVGDAIAASALVDARVFYEIDPETGRATFVGKERMHQLLEGHPELQDALSRETSEEASTILKYLHALQRLQSATGNGAKP